MCVLSSHLFWTSDCCGRTSRGHTEERGHTEILALLSVAVLAFIFIARRNQPSLSLVDREVEFWVPTNQSFSHHVEHFNLIFIFLRGKIPVRVTAAPRFELTPQRQKVSRLPTEPPGRPAAQDSDITSSTVSPTRRRAPRKYTRNAESPTKRLCLLKCVCSGSAA